MLIDEFLATYPKAKENPLKYAVESKMKEKGWGGNERRFIEDSILYQDFVEEVNDLVNNINKHEIKNI